MAKSISAYFGTATITQPATGEYKIDFGELFQGRKRTAGIASSQSLYIHTTDPFAEAFTVEVPEESERYLSTSRVDGITKPDAPITLTVSITDLSIGYPDLPLPHFFINFPDSGDSIKVEVTWYNYWVTIGIDPSDVVLAESTSEYEKWEVKLFVNDSVHPIPTGEVLKVEVLLEDIYQLPIPRRTIDQDGIPLEEPGVVGRKGVFVVFDSRSGMLPEGSRSDPAYFWVRKGDYSPGDSLPMYFGEHTDKGLYSQFSDALMVGDTGIPLNFTLYPNNARIARGGITIEWRLSKVVPEGAWDDTVSIMCGIPVGADEEDDQSYIWKFMVMQEGVDDILISEQLYTQNGIGGDQKTATPKGDVNFNPENVNYSSLAPYIIPAEEATIPIDTDVEFTTIEAKGSSKDPIIHWVIPETDYFLTGDGTATITVVCQMYTPSGILIMTEEVKTLDIDLGENIGNLDVEFKVKDHFRYDDHPDLKKEFSLRVTSNVVRSQQEPFDYYIYCTEVANNTHSLIYTGFAYDTILYPNDANFMIDDGMDKGHENSGINIYYSNEDNLFFIKGTAAFNGFNTDLQRIGNGLPRPAVDLVFEYKLDGIVSKITLEHTGMMVFNKVQEGDYFPMCGTNRVFSVITVDPGDNDESSDIGGAL